MIQLYCNRNWGFSQKVMVELIRTLFLSCMFYASHLWMNKKNMKDINSLYYKILKSTVGAVFNVRQSITEVILGLPPIYTQNKVNQIKHYLKININNVPLDRLKGNIQDISSSNYIPAELYNSLRSVYKFLRWKIRLKPDLFTNEDQTIIQENDISKFHLLSTSSCKYSKDLMKKYTELMWEDSLRNEFLFEGHSILTTKSKLHTTTNQPDIR